MSEQIRYPVTWGMGHVWEPVDGCSGEKAIAQVFKRENARRFAAALNATAGIPTSDLEEGRVLVVPVDLVRSIYYLLGKIADQDALTSYDRRRATELADELGTVLSRLQQASQHMQGGARTP